MFQPRVFRRTFSVLRARARSVRFFLSFCPALFYFLPRRGFYSGAFFFLLPASLFRFSRCVFFGASFYRPRFLFIAIRSIAPCGCVAPPPRPGFFYHDCAHIGQFAITPHAGANNLRVLAPCYRRRHIFGRAFFVPVLWCCLLHLSHTIFARVPSVLPFFYVSCGPLYSKSAFYGGTPLCR